VFRGRSAWIPDPGGDFGVALSSLLKNDRGLGVLGGRIALAVMFLLTFVLYADLLYAGSAESTLRWLDARGGLLASLPWSGRRATPARRSTKRRTKANAEDDEDDDTPASKAELDAALDDALGVAGPRRATQGPGRNRATGRRRRQEVAGREGKSKEDRTTTTTRKRRAEAASARRRGGGRAEAPSSPACSAGRARLEEAAPE
jgi:hypothetical protein